MPSQLFLWQAGAFLGFSGIALGAYGSHGLQKHITDQTRIKNWQIATNYQIMNSVALLVLSSVNNPKTGKPAILAGCLILAGTTMFSGTIYLLVLNKLRFKFLGPVTPIGALIMLAGWGSLLL
ncbi:DUF423-domain-containing protein [Rhizophagus irregularis]|nr:hypothetical protein GLOIN_2v1787041 [Rhizophagus irregularis DAOM 181602=DAOM 197198]EXX61003.1 hypothetical protein RirG_174770 [Rhizophagus irregularis DAOM 197198w]PKC03349.1 DUF423-domain-containing protein [Rhizophagus irregularis]PKC65641.1 DUF423-domain-containing protein [Rhizophagus irregularis]PKY19465.1 DUF423-domain-containing protein [Rhizophagus irregularis]POG61070.1 hypothetical protein GLOIN_2v1787041 [Rhizophagus irregularis DAOM 181602=DAOM 197198]|eukprot:XP_025167936.1 hypothetical protein GLOIN_2v1787041 [Rhizophagus irregularis DAOM 181602=DAOM 197198]